MSAAALREVAARHEVALVVQPEVHLGRRARLKRMFGVLAPTPLEAEVRRLRLPMVKFSADRIEAVRAAIRNARTDILAVASFPAILPPAILEVPGINVHTSLLPRHRGADPLFWTFHADDRNSGVTIHWLDSRVDSGDIISQQAVPVVRGMSMTQLYTDLSQIAALQLGDALDAIDHGTAVRSPQDDAQAQRDPSPMNGTWRVESDRWTSERTWHFLRGIGDAYGRFCRDAEGHPLPMGTAREYRIIDHGRAPGSYEETPAGITLYCPDGLVEVNLSTPPLSARR